MSDLPKFTLEEYIEYLKAPQWVLDGCDSESEYEADLCSKVKSWHDQSDEEFREVKQIWDVCYAALDNVNKKTVATPKPTEEAIAAAQIPITNNTMLDEIAALYAGQYMPTLKPLSKPVQQMVALGNRFIGLELKLNQWDTLKFELGIDGFVCDIWITKLYTDDSDPGPFGKDERIVFDRIEPRNCYPDPKAKRWTWESMDYFIVKEKQDIGTVKNRFKDKAARIDENLAGPDEDGQRGQNRFYMLGGGNRRWGTGAQERQQIDLKECWLHDERMKFRADLEDGPDGPQVKVDEDGYVVGDWERYYPNGRMIVTAGDRVVLRDCPNPYWHKGLPFEFCPMAPNPGKLFRVGKCAAILGIERKINDIETRVHSYAQSETERPLQCEQGTFPTNLSWYKATGQSNAIMVTQGGKSPVRRLPVEVPLFLTPYLGRLYSYKDQTAGQGGALRGEGGADERLSTEAVMARMGQAGGRQSMQSVYIAVAMMRIGYKLFSLIRETYREDLETETTDELGNPITLKWNQKDIGSDFICSVDIAANQPGGQAAVMAQATNLKREGVVDRLYCLQASGIDDYETIDNRMRKQELENIKAQGFGRSLGMQVKEFQKEDDKQAGPPVKS